jgi:phosphoribosylformylglycinamidine (FGAM) synthase-like enzyme
MSARATGGSEPLDDGGLPDLAEALGREPTPTEVAAAAELTSERCAERTARWALATLAPSPDDITACARGGVFSIALGEGLAAVLCVAPGESSRPGLAARADAAVGRALLRAAAAGGRPAAVVDAIRLPGSEEPGARAAVAMAIEGVAHAAATAGVPVLGGDLALDVACAGGPSVAAFCCALLPAGEEAARPPLHDGDPLLLVGARPGGASSLALAAGGEVCAPEIEHAFRRRQLIDASEELRRRRLAREIEPVVGCGGIARAAAAIGRRVEAGIELEREALRRLAAGAPVGEAALAEAREELLLVVVPAEGEPAAIEVATGLGLDAEPIGRLAAARATLRIADEGGCDGIDLPIELLANPTPRARRTSEPPTASPGRELRLGELHEPRDYATALRVVATAPNLASRRVLYEQLDSFTGGATALHPGADAAVLRCPGTALQIGLTVDSAARFAALDPYVGACISVCESARNLVAIGAKPAGAAVWIDAGPIDRPEVIWQLQQTVGGLRDATVAFGVPVLDRGVRFSEDAADPPLPPAPTVAMIGVLQAQVALTPWFKASGDLIFLLGRTRDELAGAEFAAVVHGMTGGTPPWVDLEAERLLHQVVLAAASRSLLASAHDVSTGGVAMAVVEGCCSAPDGVAARGARIRPDETMRPDAWLFGESQARMLVTARRETAALLRELASDAGVAIALIGEVGGTMLDIEGLVTVSVAELKAAWGTALGGWLDAR